MKELMKELLEGAKDQEAILLVLILFPSFGVLLTTCHVSVNPIVTDLAAFVMAITFLYAQFVCETPSLDKEIRNDDCKRIWLRRKKILKECSKKYMLVAVCFYLVLHLWLGESTVELISHIKGFSWTLSCEMTALCIIVAAILVEVSIIIVQHGSNYIVKRRIAMEKAERLERCKAMEASEADRKEADR